MIPLFKVYMARDIGDFVLPVLKSGYIGEGPKVKEFEHEIGRLVGNPNCVMLNSGTAAIVMALRLAGIGHDDLVLTTPMTCLATNMAILQFGAHPVWVDVLQDGTMSPDDLKLKRQQWRDAKAVICVDWGGTPCLLNELKEAAAGLPIIEDACQAVGSVYGNRLIGSSELGIDYVCFSFQAIKYLTTADGGMLIVPHAKLKEAQLMRWFGLDRTTSASMRCMQDPPIWGYKYQSNDVAAAIGLANLRYLPGLLRTVQHNGRRYDKELANIDGVCLTSPFYKSDQRHTNYWLYTILVDDPDDFIRYMAGHEIECSKAHTRNDTKTIFDKYQMTLPGVDYFEDHHVCIPVGWWVTDEDVSYIVRTIKDYGDDRIHSEKVRPAIAAR